MINYWPKRHSYICNFPLFLLVLFFAFPFWSQKEVRFHAVFTHASCSVEKSTSNELNDLFKSLNTKFTLDYFTHPQMGRLPSIQWGGRMPYFSTTMRKYRDAFFNNSHKKQGNDYYFFITEDTSGSFFIPGKNLLFFGGKSQINLAESMFRLYAASKGAQETSSLDSMLIQVAQLDATFTSIDRTFPFHDDVENIASTNGLVAYAFWEKDTNGSLQLDEGLHLPFKRNFGKVNLAVDNYWIRPFYVRSNRFIAPIHIALVLLAFFIMLVFRKKVNERVDSVLHIHQRWGFRLLRFVLWVLFFIIGYLVFWTTDSLYTRWFFGATNYASLGKISRSDFINYLNNSPGVVDQASNHLFWEAYIKDKHHWKMRRMKKVLYFKVVVDSSGRKKSMRFSHDSNRLRWKNYHAEAQTHLMVYTFYDTKGKYLKSSVFNYSNVDISSKLEQADVGKRILVFVNGYRPVSNSGSTDDALASIGKNGLEFSDSKNICYTEDRFNYWRPWGGFDQRFIERIQPNEVYYADGHHSVATSNHGSILNFVQTASRYPKPCKDEHHCEYFIKSGRKHRTLTKLPFKSNNVGFNQRRNNGKIAGKNLLQLLNEVPNHGKNDSLFIVAHSMGYAYALGMIDAIGASCQYKAFYIIAPENAQAGKIHQNQWEEVYQYGCYAFGPLRQAACLQDGIAPQTAVNGLPSEFRFTFPASYERKMGFSGSHFVGYYDWIFDIPQGQKGAVKAY
jgi:hypothetical protein